MLNHLLFRNKLCYSVFIAIGLFVFQTLQDELNVIEPSLSRTKLILERCDFLESPETGKGQSAEALQFEQLASRYRAISANVANLADQLSRASVVREELCVSCWLSFHQS